jgi:uncharacterized membrane protein
MSEASRSTAGILLVIVPTIMYGGLSLLWMISKRHPGYLDNPVRQALFRAGHAHAGVLVILALVSLLYVDQTSLSDTAKTIVRSSIPAAPLLISAGFFFSVALPKSSRPNKFIALVYLGAVSLAVGIVTLGIGLLTAS